MLSVIVVTTASPLITLIKSEWHETVPIEQNQIKLNVESVLLASYQSLYRHYEVKDITKRATTSSCNINRETGTAKPMPYSAPFQRLQRKRFLKQPL